MLSGPALYVDHDDQPNAVYVKQSRTRVEQSLSTLEHVWCQKRYDNQNNMCQQDILLRNVTHLVESIGGGKV